MGIASHGIPLTITGTFPGTRPREELSREQWLVYRIIDGVRDAMHLDRFLFQLRLDISSIVTIMTQTHRKMEMRGFDPRAPCLQSIYSTD